MAIRRLPPLNAIKAFEAAARLGGFARAAVELSVTHGAVSRQVRTLEDWLGVQLFVRTSRNAVQPRPEPLCSTKSARCPSGWRQPPSACGHAAFSNRCASRLYPTLRCGGLFRVCPHSL